MSNLPEAMGSAAELRKQGGDRRRIAVLWGTITLGLAAVTRSAPPSPTVSVPDRPLPQRLRGRRLLVVLVDAMAPEARGKADGVSGLATTLGRRRTRPGKVHADKAYDSGANRAYLRRRGIRPRVARRGVESSARLGRPAGGSSGRWRG